jgi:quercetin dioxygenase-like cupin family protein
MTSFNRARYQAYDTDRHKEKESNMRSRNRHHRWAALVVMLMLWLSSSLAFGQAEVPGPVVKYQFRTAGLPQPARFNIVQNILNFDAGAATPFHRHPGQVLVTVLEGELVFNANGADKIYKAGESFIELPGELGQARNNGTGHVSVMATFVLPWEAPLSRPEPADKTPLPRPFVSYQFKTDVQPMTDPYDVVQLVQDFAPGAATPFHTHPGIVVVTVLSGAITFQVNGGETVYKEGESFIELPNQVAKARNAGSVPTRVMASFLIPPGAPLSTSHAGTMAPAALPKTGQADSHALSDWLLLVAVVGLIAGGWLLWRARRRA